MATGTMGPTRDLGPAIVQWGDTVISEIFDEVRLTLTAADSGEVFDAIHGATPVDSIFLGYSACNVTVPATRTTLAILAELMPGGTVSGTGLVLHPALSVGLSMYDNGRPLLIKPIVAGIAAVNGTWMRLEYTYPSPNFDTVFNLRDQRVHGVTFKAHPASGDTIGDEILWSVGNVNEATSY